MSLVRTAVFPVGGLGTRFLPATKAVPKEMLPVFDRPLIQYAVDEAVAAGIESFVFTTAHGKSAVENHFDHNHELETALRTSGQTDLLETVVSNELSAGRVAYVRQREPLGLGHAVWCARHLVQDAPFAVLLPDELLRADRPPLADLIDVHAERGGIVISIMEVDPAETSRYGIIDPGDRSGDVVEVRDLIEKPAPGTAPSNFAIVGRYVLEPQVMATLSDKTPGADDEIQLTDALRTRVGRSPFHAVVFDGARYDCGTKVGLLEATVAVGLDSKEHTAEVAAAVQRALDAASEHADAIS